MAIRRQISQLAAQPAVGLPFVVQVVAGLLLLVVGIMIARQYTLRAKLLTAFLFIVLLSLGLLAALDSYLMSENLRQSTNRILDAAARQYADRIDQRKRAQARAGALEAVRGGPYERGTGGR